MKILSFLLILAISTAYASFDGGLKLTDENYSLERQFCLKNDSIYIEVYDPDLDTNGSVRETLNVQVSSPVETAGDTVKLIETWSGTEWVLRGAIKLDSSATPINNDGKIQATMGQLIIVKYQESMNQYDNPVLHERRALFVGTVIDGGTAGNVTWLKTFSPYFVNSSYQVNVGDTLTIQPGTKIYFPSNGDIHSEGVKLTVYGNLQAEGTSSDSIIFASFGIQPTADDWEGLYVYNGSIHLKYGVIRNSEYGVRWEYGYDPSPRNNLVRHSSFIRNKTAIRQYVYNAPNSSFVIDSNDIELFATLDSSSFAGISVNQSTSVEDTLIITDNKIRIHNTASSNSNYGMELYGRYSGGTYYRAVIDRNIVMADSAYTGKNTVGIYYSNFKDSDLRNNRVSGFNRGLQLCQNSGSVITGNIFTRNSRDCYIDCTPDIQIRNNAFASNAVGGYGLYNVNWADIDARNNYWGATATTEMNGGGNPKNISRIFDKMDDSYSGKVDYAGWLSDTAGTPSATGNEGFVELLENGQYTFRQHFITGENALVRVIDADLNTNNSTAQTVKIRFQTGVESTDTLVLT
ncbi:MAG: hypothetical protein JNL74_21055, partial [Fibrobacteres bacterium]|nr:hypothetical protein [Fibrobacterota bacterium]